LVRAGNRYLLLGVTASQVTTLAELTAQEAEEWLSAQDTQETQERPAFGGLFVQEGIEHIKTLFVRSPEHPTFGQALSEVLRQQKEKKGR
jgi:flagellar biogenesis protein FliO